MKKRCYYSKTNDYARYGGAGVTVCETWRASFTAFYRDIGPKPSPRHSIDRFPNRTGNYEPGNVRWATTKEQAQNRAKKPTTAVDRVCQRCGQAFRCAAYVVARGEGLFCSHKCGCTSRRVHQSVPCAHCGHPVRRTPSQLRKTERTFCSIVCTARWRWQHGGYGPQKHAKDNGMLYLSSPK